MATLLLEVYVSHVELCMYFIWCFDIGWQELCKTCLQI